MIMPEFVESGTRIALVWFRVTYVAAREGAMYRIKSVTILLVMFDVIRVS
jgi:hypothetical protein